MFSSERNCFVPGIDNREVFHDCADDLQALASQTPSVGESHNLMLIHNKQNSVSSEKLRSSHAATCVLNAEKAFYCCFGLNPSGSGYDHEILAGVVESQIQNVVPLKTHLVQGLMHVKYAGAQTSHLGQGVIVWREGASPQVSSYPLDRGSRL
ncbi:hypothetical protein TNCV_4428351 [Trichonephila clavipes]|nr:hypothetical protein TNCV_4428351 [Trichonephila clavipes]